MNSESEIRGELQAEGGEGDRAIALTNGGAANDQVLERELAGMELALTRTTSLEHLKVLSDRAAIVKEIARRMQLATEKQVRFAELQVRCARRLGEILRGEGHRGGKGSKGQEPGSRRGGSSCPLPDWINWSQSSRCQRLAAIEPAAFESLLGEARRRARPITMAAILRTQLPRQPRSTRGSVAPSAAGHLERVWAAVGRCMQADLAIGLPGRLVRASMEIRSPGSDVELVGNVVVNALGAEASWIDRLTRSKMQGAVYQAAVLIRAKTAEAWFAQLDHGAWSCCFLQSSDQSSSHAVAYAGPRWSAFHAAMRPLGTVLRGQG